MKKKTITPARQAAIARLVDLKAIAARQAADEGISYDKYTIRLAEASGIESANIRRALAGKAVPTLQVLLRICAAMRVKIIFTEDVQSDEK